MTDYALLSQQVRELLGGETNATANAANFSAFVFAELPEVNWAGFYYPDEDGGLVLGPFCGRPACARLPRGRGLCGSAFAQARTIVVGDVSAVPEHIVCDAASRSELVVPLVVDGSVRAVFDVDSPLANRFTSDDARGVEALVDVFIASTYAPLSV